MIVLVCGGREFGKLPKQEFRNGPEWEQKEKEYLFVMQQLDLFSIEHSQYYDSQDNWLPSDIEIVSGGATGVDTAAIDWAVVNWCKFREYEAQWDKYGKAAGHMRNLEMLDKEPIDIVLAFPGGKGTADTVRQAKLRNVQVIEYAFEG